MLMCIRNSRAKHVKKGGTRGAAVTVMEQTHNCRSGNGARLTCRLSCMTSFSRSLRQSAKSRVDFSIWRIRLTCNSGACLLSHHCDRQSERRTLLIDRSAKEDSPGDLLRKQTCHFSCDSITMHAKGSRVWQTIAILSGCWTQRTTQSSLHDASVSWCMVGVTLQ